MKNEEFSSNTNKEINDDSFSLGIKKVTNAICQIYSNNKESTGFLVSLPINMGNRYLYGLLTNNHNLSKDQLKPGENINLYFPEANQFFNYFIPESPFLFTCPFLDISFIEIPLGTIKNVEYLRVWDEPIVEQKIYYIKRSTESNDISFIEGKIDNFYGTNILYTNNIKDKDNGPIPGSPIISLSKFSLGDVIGISNDTLIDKTKEIKFATHIDIIINAIRSLVDNNIKRPSETLFPAKQLQPNEIYLLEKIGLKTSGNPYIFISPASFLITPLWFYRTQYAWFWTPKEPENFNLEEIKKCNWSLIKANKPIIAIGGIYNNAAPALRNIKLIQLLIISGLKFLIPSEV